MILELLFKWLDWISGTQVGVRNLLKHNLVAVYVPEIWDWKFGMVRNSGPTLHPGHERAWPVP